MNARALHLSIFLAILLGLPLHAAAPDWTPTSRLDPRTPLEIGHPLPGVGGPGVVPIPVLFGTVPEFQLFQVDIRTLDPSATVLTIDPDGSIFALGSTGETTNGTWGGVYIDDFDLRFWRSNSPHTTVESFSINAARTWIDASSAAAGPAFFVSGVDSDTGSVEIFYSVTNGVLWNSLRSFTPPANPLYFNFDGGEHVSFWVDPLATDPATTRNCFFYETRNGGLTTKWVNCADGATPDLNVPMISDVANPFNQFDKYIENRGFALSGGRSVGIFTRRTDDREWLFDFDADGNFDLYNERPAPPALEIPSFAWGDEFPATDRIRSVRPGGNDVPAIDSFFDLQSGTSTTAPGPIMNQGPLALARERRLYRVFFSSPQPGVQGLGVSSSPAPMFADGFESGDTSAWSSTFP